MKIRTGNRRAKQQGISLVELLIVLTIVAMVAGVVVVNAPPGRSDLRDTSDRFAARLDFAAQEAITKGALIGMIVGEDGYEFYRYNRGEWRALAEKNISGETFATDYTVTVERTEAAKKNVRDDQRRKSESEVRPEILFSPTGETTPLTVMFKNRREDIAVTLDNTGNIKVVTDGAAK